MVTVRSWLQQLAARRAPNDWSGQDPIVENVYAGLRRFTFVSGSLDASALFAIETVTERIVLRLNAAHPAFPLIATAVGAGDDQGGTPIEGAPPSVETLKGRVEIAETAIRLMLAAWAEYEQELTGVRLRQAEESRHDWGRVVRRIMARQA
jgi:hypothetical protein